MKKNCFTTGFQLSISALALIFTITSCTKNRSEVAKTQEPEQVASALKGNLSTLPTVSLKISVSDAGGNNLTSDGGGEYVTGLQKISAKFDQYGNFIFSCGLSGNGPNATMVRWLNINFRSPVQVFINPPITGNDKVTSITTGSVAAHTFIPLQNLAIGQSECVGLTGGSGAAWVMNFHRTAEDVSTSQSSYAVFTRINSTQWTVMPAGSCSPNSNVCALRNGPGVLYGYYNMPFSFTLTKL